MKILVSFPGRAGDLIWALPTLRAISRRINAPVDLQICGEFDSLAPLLRLQPYLRYVYADARWSMSADAQAPPALDTGGYYDHIFHLGYRQWPELGLPFETLYNLNCANQFPRRVEIGEHPIPEAELDLYIPWIAPLPHTERSDHQLTVGFSETHVELKMGLLFALGNHWPHMITVLVTPRGRQELEWMGPCACDYNLYPYDSTWMDAAWHIGNSAVFLGCCSGLHVLAVAMGIPVILYEPMAARHNPIFYPLGWDGPQVTRVVGNDGEWTTDSRHTAELIQRKLAELSHAG